MSNSRRYSNGTAIDVMSPTFTDTSLNAVIHCDGFGAALVQETVPFFNGGSGLQSLRLVRDGFTVYKPFSGDCWGNDTFSSHTIGKSVAAGLDGLTDAYNLAVADGFPATVNLVGFSAGGLDAMSWAMQNPWLVNKLYLHFPCFSIESTAETPILETSITNAWGASYVTASAAADPYQNNASIDAIASQIKAMASPEDDIVDWTLLKPWCAARGIDLLELSGEHGFQIDDPRFSMEFAGGWFKS